MDPNPTATHPHPIGWFRDLVATIGGWVVYGLCQLFGRTHRRRDVPWLDGPVGGRLIGDAPYRDVAVEEGLTVERRARDSGLVPDWTALGCDGFDPARTHPLVREFYEHTTEFTMDVWSRTYFPTSIGLALLVTTISRQVNQLNFPLSPLETAYGMNSEIILLRRADGSVRYTGWFRTMGEEQRVLYTGFYMVGETPNEAGPCVKVVFPMPRGNATVLLRPGLGEDGSLILESSGRRFGDAGFYRVHLRDAERIRVWYIRSLKERFHVYVDERGVLRCDHTVRFLGLPVVRLHYKIVRQPDADAAPG
ncbi:MAG TPA: hypothetical protein VEW03_00140 [Longimicrobiaceae bacterium]|nr:hypothetical protein [Longimicrobiaceae bacterium]